MSKREPAIYFSVVLLLVLPLWATSYALTQDGPMHLHNSRILLDHWLGRGVDFYREYYVPNLSLFPYWIGHLSGAALIAVFSPATAEKVFLSAAIVLYAIGLRRLVLAINPEAGWMAFAGLPLFWNRTFQMGFFDFIFSIGVLLWLLDFYVRRARAMTVPRAVALSLFFLLLYFCHPTTFLFGVGTVLTLAVVGGRRYFLHVALAIAPSAALMAMFLRGAPNYAIARPTPYSTVTMNFLQQTNLAAWANAEAPIAIAAALMFGMLLIAAIGHRLKGGGPQLSDAFLAAAAAALVVDLYGTARLIGFFSRFQFMPLVMLLPWLAARQWPAYARRAIPIAAAVLVLAFVALRYPRQAYASEVVAEYMTAQSSIEPRSTVLVLNYDYTGRRPEGDVSEVLPILLHSAEYLGAGDRSLIILNNIGGLYPMYPYLWRADRNPYDRLAPNIGLEADPPSADFLTYPVRTGGTVDYVVTLGYPSSPFSAHPNTVSVMNQLARGYTRVFTSAKERVAVYRARPPEAPSAGDDPAALLNFSLQLYQARRYAESIDAARRVLAIEPNSDRAYNNICAGYNSLEQWDQAIAACNEALKLNPNNQIARNNLAWALSRK